jgi:hypothetical protein
MIWGCEGCITSEVAEGAWFNKAVYASTVLLFVSWVFKLAEFQFAGY